MDDTLIEIKGIVADAREEGGSRYGDLVIKIESSKIHYRSPMAYPVGFKHGDETAELLKPGTQIVLLLEERQFNAAPRKHRIKGYEWHEFVGLSSGDVVHFSPKSHERYERRNNQLGKYLMPLIALMAAWLVVHEVRKPSTDSA